MITNHRFGDVDARGALIRTQAAPLRAAHQAIVRDVPAAVSNMTNTDNAVGSS